MNRNSSEKYSQGQDLSHQTVSLSPGNSQLDLVRPLLHSAVHGMFVCGLNGFLLDANPSFLKLVGYSAAEIHGLDMATLVGASCRQRFQKLRAEVNHTGNLSSFCEIALVNKAGQQLWVALEGLKIDRPHEPALFLGFVHDLTSRKALEDQLRVNDANYRTLLNASLHAAFLVDTCGVILAVNEQGAQRLGHRPHEIIGSKLQQFVPPETGELRRKMGMKAIRRGKGVRFEDQLDGVIYEHLFFPVRNQDGSVTQLAIYSVDITERKAADEERKRLQAQLQQAQKMEAIGTLAGGIAHDFNNLMMAIQGNVSLMLMNMPATHGHYEPLKNIEKGIRRGADLTSKLLGYARKGKYEIKPVCLNLLVTEIAETFGRMRKDVTIEKALAEDLNGIMADKGQLEQVLLNLFINAADAMPTGGKLTLKTRNVTHESIPTKMYRAKPGMYVQLSVSDTGSGMTPEVQERIYDPFFTTKKMGRGTGLGLASAYGIIKSHNGYIEVESQVNRGATFFIYLPASKLKPRQHDEDNNQLTTGSGTVLVADDEQNVLTVTSQMLSRSGYRVMEAQSGHEAIELYSQNQKDIDLVILDMVMPKMGGGEVYDRIKALNPAVKVLLASGYSLEGQAREIMKRGCDGFIQKPFSLTELAQRVHAILEVR